MTPPIGSYTAGIAGAYARLPMAGKIDKVPRKYVFDLLQKVYTFYRYSLILALISLNKKRRENPRVKAWRKKAFFLVDSLPIYF